MVLALPYGMCPSAPRWRALHAPLDLLVRKIGAPWQPEWLWQRGGLLAAADRRGPGHMHTRWYRSEYVASRIPTRCARSHADGRFTGLPAESRNVKVERGYGHPHR